MEEKKPTLRLGEKMSNNAPRLLSRAEARQKLQVPAPVFNALLTSGLLGIATTDGRLLADSIEHYKRYGTQWETAQRFGALGTRLIPADFYQNPPPVPDVGIQPPDTQAQGQIWPSGVPEGAADNDTGWLAQFYLIPNEFFFPNPMDMAMIGSLPLKLDAPKRVRGTSLAACLYPDPTGSMAMISVTGRNQPTHKAFATAYDVAVPILDELSVKYDVPLPIVQTVIILVPSGIIDVFFAQHPAVKKIEGGDVVEPHAPYPELRAAEALYREAVSSNNPFHRFLAYWKVYEEAVYVRTGWRQKHKREDVKVQEEVVPNVFAFGADKEQIATPVEADEERFGEKDFRGFNFHEARVRLNRPDRPYRVALAHAGDVKGGKPLTAASGEEFTDVSRMVPLVRYMARVVLENVRATLASSAGERDANS